MAGTEALNFSSVNVPIYSPQGLRSDVSKHTRLQYGNSDPGLALTACKDDNLYKKFLTERYGARLVGTTQLVALWGGLMGASPLSGHLWTSGDLLSSAAFTPEWASPGGRRVFVNTVGIV